MTPTFRPKSGNDVFAPASRPLAPFFAPRRVAVIGATETAGSVGRTILANLLASPFGGEVYPVNPKRGSVLGVPAHPSIKDVPAAVDLAVIVTPAATVPRIVSECAVAGVPAAIVISAGFRETGAAGRALEQEALVHARRGGMRIVGPNCLGLMNPHSGLNATFAHGMARRGGVAFLSQSGALLTAILDWSFREQVGFSGFVSVGTMLDVGWGDLIDHFGDDPHTRAIVLYMETIGDARAFMSAAREVALSKPIIVLKAGRSLQAAHAAASHTGALAGADDVLDAAFRRCGVLRVSRIGDLFGMADVLSKQPRPRGPRLTIVTNAGGPAVLATDALVAAGGDLAPLSAAGKARLDQTLPAAWSGGNPIDVLGDATPERYAQALGVVADEPDTDGLLVVLTPQDMTDPTRTAEALRAYAHVADKPVLASFMGGATVEAGVESLARAGIPCFEHPDSAAETFCQMWRHSERLRALYETPVAGDEAGPDRASATAVLNSASSAGRTLLTEEESKRVLAAYGIPVVPTKRAHTDSEAAAAAVSLGFPVVLKLLSRTITHKSDVGGVVLDVRTEADVVRAFSAIRASVSRVAGEGHFEGVTVQPMVVRTGACEIIVGSSFDPQVGPVLLFGVGGTLVEVMKDRALALPPLNRTLARRLMEETKIYAALKGVRGSGPLDVEGVERTLIHLGQLVLDEPRIKEIDVNPLLVSAAGVQALDARVVLHPRGFAPPRAAIRPYPRQYAGTWTSRAGEALTVRPIRPEDEPSLVAFHRELSDQSVRQRYFQNLNLDARTAHERLVRVCFADYDRDIVLLALRGAKPDEVVAVGRLSRNRTDARTAECALLVKDAWQRRGVGSELLRRLLEIARLEGMTTVTEDILADNLPMQRMSARLGFELENPGTEGVVRAVWRL